MECCAGDRATKLYGRGKNYAPKHPANDFLSRGSVPATRFFMLSSGFALGGSSYATTGWAIQQALPDQIAVLDIFAKTVGMWGTRAVPFRRHLDEVRGAVGNAAG
jgi:hypothetical protein